MVGGSATEPPPLPSGPSAVTTSSVGGDAAGTPGLAAGVAPSDGGDVDVAAV